MIREHAEKISSVLEELAKTDGTRDASKMVALLTSAYDESNAILDELNQTPDYKSMYEELLANHTSQSSMLEESLEENKALKATLENLENTIANYEAAIAEERAAKENLEEQKESLLVKCAETEGKLAVVSENNNPMQKEIFRSLQRIETAFTKLNSKVDGSRKDLASHSVEVSNLAKSVDSLVKTNDSVVDVTQIYSETLEDLREELSNTNENIEEVADAQNELRTEFENVLGDVNAINTVAEEAKKEAKESKDASSKCVSLFDKLKGVFGE